MKKLLLISFLLIGLLAPVPGIHAQEEAPAGPIYVVEQGDTLSSIALNFGVTVADLLRANNLSDANALFVGDQMVIPGLEGISGRLETATVDLGENMRSLSRRYQIPPDLFARLNRLVSQGELHRGASLVLTRSQSLNNPGRLSMPAGQSLLETAVRSNVNPWALSHWNSANSPIDVVPGDLLFVPDLGNAETESPGALPGSIRSITLNSLYQGEAGALLLSSSQDLTLSGRLGPYRFDMIDAGDGSYVALQGIHALLEPGMYPLHLSGSLADGTPVDFVQMVKIIKRDYIFEYINVAQELIDPETTEAETARIMPYLTQITPNKIWDGVFAAPSPFEGCINSTFGNRRSYNGSAFSYYHSGVDYCGGTGVEIFAPAKGTVVFTDLLDVSGNLTIIDHGWGVFSTYMHQSEIFVSTGDTVQPGEVIGLIGNTGRSTGPHLHWEIWVNGVPVDPLDWLTAAYP